MMADNAAATATIPETETESENGLARKIMTLTLQSTVHVSQQTRNTVPATLVSLPPELLLQIFSHLPPVYSTCLGLTRKRFYVLHTRIHGPVNLAAKTLSRERGSTYYGSRLPERPQDLWPLGRLLEDWAGPAWFYFWDGATTFHRRYGPSRDHGVPKLVGGEEFAEEFQDAYEEGGGEADQNSIEGPVDGEKEPEPLDPEVQNAILKRNLKDAGLGGEDEEDQGMVDLLRYDEDSGPELQDEDEDED